MSDPHPAPGFLAMASSHPGSLVCPSAGFPGPGANPRGPGPGSAHRCLTSCRGGIGSLFVLWGLSAWGPMSQAGGTPWIPLAMHQGDPRCMRRVRSPKQFLPCQPLAILSPALRADGVELGAQHPPPQSWTPDPCPVQRPFLASFIWGHPRGKFRVPGTG